MFRLDPGAVPGLLEAILEAAAHADLGVVVTRVSPVQNLYVSPRAAAMLGMDPEGDPGAASPFERVAPEARADIEALYARHMAGEPPPSRFQTVLAPLSGGRVPVEISRAEITIEGQRCTVVLMRDLSHQRAAEDGLRRSEARLRTLIESAPDGIVISRAREIVFANRAAAALLGAPDAAALVGRSFQDYLHPEDFKTMGERVQQLRPGGPPNGPSEYRARSESGEARVVEVSSVALDDEDGPSVVGFARDVTSARRLQAQLVRADRLAALGTMAAGMAHEINNPLAFMMLGLDAIERRLATDPPDLAAVRATLSDLRHGVSRVASIVRQLRTFSRTEEPSARGAVDLALVLEAASQMVAHEVRQYGTLHVSVEDALPAVRGEAGRLEQVFLNVLLNAAQALDLARGEGRIEVHARVLEAARVEVTVRDNGRGISDAELARVFDPFFTTKPVGKGTGLGLSICHSLLTGMGATIAVESEVGVGTTVRVRIPAHARSAARPTTPAWPTRREDLTGSLRVLVVDDEVALLRAVERLLGKQHVVHVADSAARAHEIFAAEPLDAILLDVMMPGTSGMELFEHLSAERPQLVPRVAFITGGTAREEIERFIAQSRRPVLRKPFGAAELQALLRRLSR